MGSDRRWFLLCFVTFAYFYQGGFANINSRFDLTLSLALGHRYDIGALADNTIDKAHVGHLTYSEKAPGSAFAALPVPAVASLVMGLDTLGRRPGLGDLLLHLATAFSVGLLSAGAAVAFRRTLTLLDPARSLTWAWAVTGSIFFGTPLFVYSTMLFGHALAAAWLVLGLYAALLAARGRERGPAMGNAAIAVAALGFAVLTEYPVVLPAACIAAGALAVAHRPRWLLAGLPAGLIPLGLLLLHQYASFGSPLAVGYGHLEGTQFATGMSRGLFGIGVPSLAAAAQLLFGVYRGLFVYAPVLVLAVIAFAWWPRGWRRLAVALLAASASLWLAIAGYSYWQGGPAFGPRHLVPVMPLLGLGLAFWPDGRRWRWLLGVVAAVSVGINLAGTATTPFIDEYVPDPILSVYPGLVRDGALSLNPNTFLTPADQVDDRWAHAAQYPHASYNLGELLGLGGWLSLAPLATVWIVGIGWDVRRRHLEV